MHARSAEDSQCGTPWRFRTRYERSGHQTRVLPWIVFIGLHGAACPRGRWLQGEPGTGGSAWASWAGVRLGDKLGDVQGEGNMRSDAWLSSIRDLEPISVLPSGSGAGSEDANLSFES